MTPEQITTLAATGETETVEFKATTGTRRETATATAPKPRTACWRRCGSAPRRSSTCTWNGLQILVIGHVDRDDVDALLWDPMPGGSGLLDQLCERFAEVVEAAREVASACPG